MLQLIRPFSLYFGVSLGRDEQGQGLVEYALILVLIAVVLVAAVQGYGEALRATYDRIVTLLASLGGSS